jgi:hypothetical protein
MLKNFFLVSAFSNICAFFLIHVFDLFLLCKKKKNKKWKKHKAKKKASKKHNKNCACKIQNLLFFEFIDKISLKKEKNVTRVFVYRIFGKKTR